MGDMVEAARAAAAGADSYGHPGHAGFHDGSLVPMQNLARVGRKFAQRMNQPITWKQPREEAEEDASD